MNEFASKPFARYGELRPHHRVPSSSADLLGSNEAVFRKRFASHLPLKKDARILDLGCGYGEFLYFLQRAGYENAAGVELDPGQAEVARGLGIKNVRCGDGRELLRASPGEFEFISAIDVVEHFPKAQVLELLKLVYAALVPGGKFLCQVPNAGAFYLPVFYMDFTHETPFAPTSLKQALEVAGFTNVLVSGMGPVAHGVKSSVRYVLWKAIESGLRFIQTVEGGPRGPLDRIFTAAIFAIADKPGGSLSVV
jgi:SAM-dependent methyltransferase